MAMSAAIINRFWKNVKKSDGCWEWIGPKFTHGKYGRFNIDYKSERSHRFSYELHNGEIPKNMYVCHKCDNPSCVNPEHLFLGSQSSNLCDASEKGRLKFLKGLKREEVIKLKEMYKTGKFTQCELGRTFGINQSEISRWLTGKRRSRQI